MITFPNAKINIGLDVLNKRPDSYHNIESLFYPIPLQDALEIIPSNGELEYTTSGIALECVADDNLVVKAFRLLQEQYHLPNVKIHLHKHIPFGAGLGGGSSDAAFTLRMINEMFELNISETQLIKYAASLGADCAFFIKNTPQMASGIGDVLTDASLSLKGKYLLLLKPNIAVPTASAYRFIVPRQPEVPLSKHLSLPLKQWEGLVKNDFEISVFRQFPHLAELKAMMYNLGAEYAAMSGSGSSIYGIFDEKPQHNATFASYFCFEAEL